MPMTFFKISAAILLAAIFGPGLLLLIPVFIFRKPIGMFLARRRLGIPMVIRENRPLDDNEVYYMPCPPFPPPLTSQQILAEIAAR